MSARVAAVVVARTGPTAKSRLAPVLSADERAALALAMLEDVLAACAGLPRTDQGPTTNDQRHPPGAPSSVLGPSSSVSGLVRIVVVDTLAGRAVAERAGFLALTDPGDGLNAAVEAGLAAAERAGADAALVLPGDVPLIRSDDLQALLAAAGDASRAVIVATDHAGTGTNALLLRPPRLVAPSFGIGSAARHLAAGRTAEAFVLRMDHPALGLDIDTPENLAELRRRQPNGATGAALTRLVGR